MNTTVETRQMQIAELTPAPYNPREISAPALAGLRASIGRWGVVQPVIWNKRTRRVVGGHQRLKVLVEAGEVETTVIVVDLPDDEEKALNITLNNPEIAGTWTAGVLPLIDEIKAALGEAADALRLDELRETAERCLREAANLRKAKGEEPDNVPEASIVPITQPGDLWVLGEHRIICGDSRDPDVIARLMDGKQAVLYNTDPPYGVGYDGMNHPKNMQAKITDPSGNRDWSAEYEDHNAWDHFEDRAEFEQMLIDVFTAAKPHLIEDAAWYCWHAAATVRSFLSAWERAGIRFHQSIVWVKPCAVLGFSMWNWRNEPCLMGWQQGHKPAVYQVPDEMTNVWEVDWEGKARCTAGVHPTQKPVRLFELPMLKHTNPGEICLETFSGSGSQIIAAERLGRRCFAVERLPQFVDVAVKRWELMTGKQAVRA